MAKKPIIILLIIIMISALAGIGYFFLEKRTEKLENGSGYSNNYPLTLEEARKKAKDARVQAGLLQMRALGEMKRQEKNYNFSGFCEEKEIKELVKDIEGQGANVVCNDSENDWAAQVDLQFGDYDYFCVDGKLNREENNHALEDSTECQ